MAQITEVVLQTGIKLHFVNQFSLAILQLDQGDITDTVVLDSKYILQESLNKTNFIKKTLLCMLAEYTQPGHS